MESRVKIVYCAQCRWLPRACWMAHELLTTFEQELDEVTLSPGSGGTFNVFLNGEMIFSRAEKESFPESKELKQLIRDRIVPDLDLGHSDW